MFKKVKKIDDNIYTVIDVGTTKICTIIARKVKEDNKSFFHVEGVGIVPSQGMKKGTIMQMRQAAHSISESIKIAEKRANLKAENIHIGFADSAVTSCNINAKITLPHEDNAVTRKITPADIDQLIEESKRIAKLQPVYSNLTIIHAIPQYFSVDGGTNVPDPISMEGSTLSCKVHLVFADKCKIKNILYCFSKIDYNLKQENIILEPIASAYAVLKPEQKDLGAIMIDIGGGTTDVVVYYEKVLRASFVVPNGAQELTRYLSNFLMVSSQVAEGAKINHGCALQDECDPEKAFILTHITGKCNISVKNKAFAKKIEEEMTHRIKYIFQKLSQTIRIGEYCAGIYLTGGGSSLYKLDKLIENLTNIITHTCKPDLSLFKGSKTNLEGPEFSTAIGIFLYILDKENEKEIRFPPKEKKRNFKSFISGLFSTLKK